MPADNIQPTGHISPFERIRHSDDACEYWSARELSKVLGYALWQNFSVAIQRAQTACANDAHLQIGRAVREAIIGMGGTPPEHLPTPEKSVKQLRREEARRQQIEAEDRLGLFAQLNALDGDSDTDEGD